MSILGYSWAQIQAAQQGHKLGTPLPKYDQSVHADKVQTDVDRFHIPLHKEVRDRYATVLPTGYVLEADMWLWKGES